MNNKPESHIIDGFSVLEMKQTIQAEIIRRTQGMTYEELRHYLDESLKDQYTDGFVAEHAKTEVNSAS
jgi:hypothetical protein